MSIFGFGTRLSPYPTSLNELSVGGEKIDRDDDFGVDEEPDTETTDAGEEPAETTEETTDDDYSIPDEEGDTTGEAEEEAPADEGGEEDAADTGDDEYSVDAGEEDAGGEDTAGDAETPTDTREEATGEDPEVKEAEDQLYDVLSDDQKKIRTLQLKQNFKDLFDETDTIINAVNVIPKSDTNIEAIRRLIGTISDVKQYLLDYIATVFDKTSYLDNQQLYIKYINVFRTIKKTIDELAVDQKK